MKISKFDRTKEHEKILNQCLLELTTRGFLCWKNNTGAMKVGERYQRFGLKGSSDILSIAPSGIFFALEIKSGKAVQSKAQIAFQKAVEKRNAVYWIIHSLDELREKLDV